MYNYEYYIFLTQVEACKEFLSPVDEILAKPWVKELQELQQILEQFFKNHEKVPESKRGGFCND